MEQERVSSFKECSQLENFGTQLGRLEVQFRGRGFGLSTRLTYYEDPRASGIKMTVRCLTSESQEAYETQSNSN